MKMSLKLLVVCAAMSLHLVPVALMAQQRVPVAGDRVRVRLTTQREVEGAAYPQLLRGTVVEVTADSLQLRLHPAADITAIARTGINRVDLSHGLRTRLESAAYNGARMAVTGMVHRLIFAAVADLDEDAGESALIGAAGGALIGIAVGAVLPQERWKRVRNWK